MQSAKNKTMKQIEALETKIREGFEGDMRDF